MNTITAIGIYILACIVVFFGPPYWDQSSGLATTIDKHRRLDELGPNKIVLIGGSNVMTGIDSSAIQIALDRKVVNMGLGVSLGLRYMLEEVKDSVRAGDVLVIFPEYDFFFRSPDGPSLSGNSDLLELSKVNPSTIKWICAAYCGSRTGIFDILDSMQLLITRKFQFYQKVASKIAYEHKNIFSPELLEPVNTIYIHRESYNNLGDFVGHLQLPSPGIKGDRLNYSDYEFKAEAQNLLSEFSNWVALKGAKVFVLPPPFPESLYRKRGSTVEDIYAHLKHEKKISALATPQRYVFADQLFFDTAYHLNVIGRNHRTARIIEDLKPRLADCSSLR